MSVTRVLPEIREWLIPSSARELIADVRARGAWGEVPWGEPGAVLNVLDVLGEGYTDVVRLPPAITLQHFTNPQFVLRAFEIVKYHALVLTIAAYDVFSDPAPWLDWESLNLITCHTDGVADWMMDRGLWDLPTMPVESRRDMELVGDIGYRDVRFWHRVEIDFDDTEHCHMAADGVRNRPEALLYMRFLVSPEYTDWLRDADRLNLGEWKHSSMRDFYYGLWTKLRDIAAAKDPAVAEQAQAPSWLQG